MPATLSTKLPQRSLLAPAARTWPEPVMSTRPWAKRCVKPRSRCKAAPLIPDMMRGRFPSGALALVMLVWALPAFTEEDDGFALLKKAWFEARTPHFRTY